MFTLTIIQTLQDWLHGWLDGTAQGRLVANAIMVVVTVVLFWIIYRIVFRIFNRISQRVLKEDSQLQPLHIQKQEILSAQEVGRILNVGVQIVSWVLRIYILLLFLNTGPLNAALVACVPASLRARATCRWCSAAATWRAAQRPSSPAGHST